MQVAANESRLAASGFRRCEPPGQYVPQRGEREGPSPSLNKADPARTGRHQLVLSLKVKGFLSLERLGLVLLTCPSQHSKLLDRKIHRLRSTGHNVIPPALRVRISKGGTE